VSIHKDLLEQAKHLVYRETNRPKQASLRRAVSAAYYALFHLLVSEATKLIRPARIRVHVRRLYEHGSMRSVCKTWALGSVANLPTQSAAIATSPIEPDLRAVAAAFVDLQEARHRADYDLTQLFTRSDSIQLVSRADSAFSDWKAVRSSDNASAFLAALLFERRWRGPR
jgi:uncharacterized protein (UPF0332 family)